MKITLDLELVWESPSLLHFLFYTQNTAIKVMKEAPGFLIICCILSSPRLKAAVKIQ